MLKRTRIISFFVLAISLSSSFGRNNKLQISPSAIVNENKATHRIQNWPLRDAGEPFGMLPLVDEVICGNSRDDHAFKESPEGATHVETILGKAARVLINEGEAKYFAYRLGKGKNLVPGAAYVLTIEYPEDKPRSMFISNRGSETVIGFGTGATVGDVLHGRYVTSNPESLRIPLSGKWQRWSTLFCLHDRYPDILQPRGAGPRGRRKDRCGGPRHQATRANSARAGNGGGGRGSISFLRVSRLARAMTVGSS